MKSFGYFLLVVLLVVAGLMLSADIANNVVLNASFPAGHWLGTVTDHDGTHSYDMVISSVDNKGNLKGWIKFNPEIQQNPTPGISQNTVIGLKYGYLVSGTYDAKTQQVNLVGTDWMRKPNWVMDDFTGKLDPVKKTFTGKPIPGKEVKDKQAYLSAEKNAQFSLTYTPVTGLDITKLWLRAYGKWLLIAVVGIIFFFRKTARDYRREAEQEKKAKQLEEQKLYQIPDNLPEYPVGVSPVAFSEKEIKDSLDYLRRLNVERLQELDEHERAIKRAGEEGERRVNYALSWLDGCYEVIKGVSLDGGGEVQEFDHIVIGPNGIFNIETKNYSGHITIDEAGNWRREKNGKVEGMVNPLAQANRHHKVLSRIIGREFPITDIIVLANESCIVDGTKNSRIPVVRFDSLQDFIEHYDSAQKLSPEDISQIKNTIKSAKVERSIPEPSFAPAPGAELNPPRTDGYYLLKKLNKYIVLTFFDDNGMSVGQFDANNWNLKGIVKYVINKNQRKIVTGFYRTIGNKILCFNDDGHLIQLNGAKKLESFYYGDMHKDGLNLEFQDPVLGKEKGYFRFVPMNQEELQNEIA